MDELLTKKFPQNYPEDAVKILDSMSFTGGKDLKILGSMSLRSQQYAGDYDGYEVVELHEKTNTEALHKLAKRFQDMVRHLESLHNVYVGDIKAGSIEALRVIDKNSFDAGKCKNKVRLLLKKGLITKDEAHDSLEILSSGDELLARSKIKFHIVRWTPAEVLAGHKTLRDGSDMTLEKAFNCPTIAKMDIIGFVQNNRYTDFSVIYEFRNRGKALNPDKIDIEKSLKQNIKGYEKEGNYFKAMKRQFALAKYTGDKKTIERLTPILNSDLGRLYHVLGDIGTLETLLEEHNAPLKKVRYEIDQFKNRLANVYTLKDYLKEEPHILKEIDAILKKPKGKILKPLSQVGRELEAFLQSNAKKLYGAGDVVIPKKDFIAEHEHLIKLLNDVNNPKTRKEAKKQLAELRRLRGAGWWDTITRGISDAFNKVKEIPVLGKVVDVVSQPFQNLATAVDKGARATADLVQGNVSGALNNATGLADSLINQESAAIKLAKGTPLEGLAKDLTNLAEQNVKVPGLGVSVAEAKQTANQLMGKGKRIKSQALGNILQEKLTPLIQNLAKEKDGKGRRARRGIEYRLM